MKASFIPVLMISGMVRVAVFAAVSLPCLASAETGPPAITFDPVSISVRSGEVAETSLSLSNPTGSQLVWRLEALDANDRRAALEGQLDAIANSGETLDGPLPLRFDFTGGEAGKTTLDATSPNNLSMLRDSNRLLTDLGGPLVYTDDHVASSPALGADGRYFTRKMPGLFVFGAETNGISWFEVAGTVSHGTSKESGSFELFHAGKRWSAFVVNHADYWRSYNHLVLVDQGGLQQTTGANNSQQQRITGLSGKRRIYQFLYVSSTTAVQPQQVFEELALRFLDLLPDFGSRMSFDPAGGVTPPSGTGSSVASFDATGVEPGIYEGTIRAESATGEALASSPATVTVSPPRVEVPGELGRLMFPGQVPKTVELPFTTSLSEPQPWVAALESPAGWLTLENGTGTTPESLRLRLNPAGLAVGNYKALVSVSSGPANYHIPVTLRIRDLAIGKFVADPARPRVYAIHQDGFNEGAVVVFDSITRRILHSIPTGKEPTDFDLTENGDQLVVMNTSDPSLSMVDLESLTVAETIPLTEFSNRNDDVGGHVQCGKGSIVYYVDEQWGPRLRVFDTATRTVLQTFSATSGSSPNLSNNNGYGDIGLSPDRWSLYGWVQYGDGAGWAGTAVVRFTVDQDGRLSDFAKSTDYYQASSNFGREPFDTPVLVSDDGSRVLIKDREVDPEDLDAFPLVYPSPLYSIAANGRIAASASKIYSTSDAREIASLPVTATVQMIMPDISALVYFDAGTRTVEWLDLQEAVGGEALGVTVAPADRAVVTSTSRLEWPGLTGITRYRVYLGTSGLMVNAGRPGSSSDLGETTAPWIDLATPPGTGRYFWRVVPLDDDGNELVHGRLYSFTVANVALSRSSIRAATIAGNPNHRETIEITAPDTRDWTATSDVPWIRFENDTGTTPGTLEVVIDASALSAGIRTENIRIASGGFTIEVPVTLTLHEPNYTLVRADLDAPFIYAVSEGSLPDQPAFLVVIDAGTGNIRRTLSVGSSVTGMSVHYADNRIYLTNWKGGLLRAIDRDSLEEVRVYAFNPPTSGYGTGDTYVVAAGRSGRIMVEEQDQSIKVHLVDTVTGQKIATAPGSLRQGGGAFEPAGRFYYHGERHSPGAALKKFDTEGDAFELLGTQRVSSIGYRGSRLLEISGDGSRVFWNGGVFDPDLNVLMELDEEVVASTYRGEVLFTSTKALNGSSGEVLATLPVDTRMQAVSGDQRKLFLFKNAAFTVVDIASIADVPLRGLVPGVADQAVVIGTSQELSWSREAAALSYDVYFGSSASAVTAATKDSPEFLGNVAGTTWTGDLPDLALGGEYFWRIDLNGFSSVTKGDIWSFQVAPVDVAPRRVELAAPSGAPIPRQTLEMTSATPLAWTASSSTSWISVVNPSGTTPDVLEFDVLPTGLSVGTHNGSVEISYADGVVSVPVSLDIHQMNYTLAHADLNAPLIYAVSEGPETDSPAFLVVIDTTSNAIAHTLPVGTSVTSMSVHYADNRIYLTNWRTGALRAYDRTTFAQVQTYEFSPAGATGHRNGDVYVVAAGRSGRIMVEEEDQWINSWLVDTATGNKLASFFSREGGGLFDPTGRYYFHGENNSSGAKLGKYDTDGDEITTVGTQRVSSYSHFGSRLVTISGDGSRVFWNGGVFDRDLDVLMQLDEEVVASTYRGELLFTNTKALNGSSSEVLSTLPVDTKMQAVSGDQRKLFLFKDADFTVVDIASIADVPPRGLVPGIADQAVVIGVSQELSWSQEAAALSYDVYFGSSASAVTAATKDSPEFLGNVTGTAWTGALPDLALGGEYFWRIDLNGFSSDTKGGVWSFQVAPVDVAPRRVDLAVPSGAPIPRQTLEMTSATPLAWTASSSTPWISVVNTSGTTPDTLHFDISSAGMSVGARSGSITVQADGVTFSVPVELSVVTLNVTQLVPHPERQVVYAINTALDGEGFSHLLELDAATAAIRRTLPIGFAPTDADLDAANGRLYVTNWGYSQTRVIDVEAWSELSPLNLGTDIFKLAVTPDGRLITEEKDQWIQLQMWDAATGGNLAKRGSVRQGDGKVHPSGNHYYHADSNISNAVVRRYDIRGNSFEQDATGPQIGSGSRNLVMSADGSRLFWLGRVMDEDLTLLAQMPAEVHATNRGGDLAVGPEVVWWSDSATEVAQLPFASTVAAFSADDTHLLRFNATTRTLHSVPVSSLTDLPGPWPRPGQVLAESPARFSWTPVAGATSYRIYIAKDSTSLQSMAAPTATVVTAEYEPATPLAFGRFFAWRVDAVTGSGVVTGTTHEFGIEFPAGPALPQLGTNSAGIAASLADRHLLVGLRGSAQLYDFDPADGRATPIQNFTLPGHYITHNFGAAVAMDAGKASVGAYGESRAYVFRPGAHGLWEGTDPITPPDPVSNEQFGHGVAASGNMMLVGTSGHHSVRGRVCAYVTEPGVTLTQTFSADDGVANDGFGKVIAMDGNHAVIAAPGRGPTFNRLPCLYAFSRSTSTGLWSQTQKITISGATVSTNVIRAIALSGNTLATTSGNNGVILYNRSRSGQWIESATISGSAFANSSTSFGSGLALVGDQLFIGDFSASYKGTTGGAVFSFRRSGTSWVAGPVIAPSGSRSGFGVALSVRDHWLVVAGGDSQPAWVYRVGATENRTPRFLPGLPTQVVVGREFSVPVQAEDADGQSGLVINKLQGPAWLGIDDLGNGQATLSGTPSGSSGDDHQVQLQVQDASGGHARHTYILTLLAPTDLPVLDSSPTPASLGVGQELVLRASVSGVGPFQWQWYRNGEAIDGATGRTHVIGEVGFENAGLYHVRVANVVGADESAAVEVSVRPADRFAGEWPTFGGSPAHTGRHPAALDSTRFLPAWTAEVQPGTTLNRAAIADGRAVVVPASRFGSGIAVGGIELESGASLWSYPFPTANSSNPPSIHEGRVYFQRGNHGNDTQLICLDAATGAEIWKSPFGAQWESYEAPAVTDLGIFINGGTYGGMYGFNFDGGQRFFQSLAQVDRWTPTIHQGRLFTWTRGSFIEHNPTDGSNLWSLNDLSGTGVIAASGDSAVIRADGLTCIDLPTRQVRWQLSGSFGQPAIGDGRVFAIEGDAVSSYMLADGSPDVIYQTTAGTHSSARLIEQPILFNDRLVISSEMKTWIFNFQDGTLLQTLDAGGRLSYSNGYLLAAGNDGTLRAFLATPHGRIAVHGPDGEGLTNGETGVRCGAPPVGSTSLTVMTLRNTGLADLSGFSWEFEGENAAEFTLTGPPSETLIPGGESTLEITFTPTAKGRREALLVVSSDDPGTPEFRIPLFALPPDVEGLAATDITGVSAILNGAVTANDNLVDITFEYGLTNDYGSTATADPAALSGDDDSPVSAAIAGLPPGTLHHYRVGVTNSEGTHWSEGMTFTTLSDNARLTGITNRLSNRRPAFDSETFVYIASVNFDTSELEMRPLTEHPGATLAINGIAVPRGEYSPPLPLAVGNNTLDTVVTAEDGVTTLTYTTVVTRLPEFFDLSGSATPPVSANGFSAEGQPADLRLDFHPPVGTSLMVVENTGLDPIHGEFANLTQGQKIVLNFGGIDYPFVANYYGGSGNDLVLHWADTAAVAWGLNNQGQLGDGTTVNAASPVSVEKPEGVLADKTLFALSAGYLHSLALLHDGTVAAWGYNTQGQLGLGHQNHNHLPQQVRADGALDGKTVIYVSAGAFHNLALCADGTIVSWGLNNHGQLGTGDRVMRAAPVIVEPLGALAGKRVVAVAAGFYHSFALCSDGSVAAWGYNDEGELGDGGTETALVPVAVDAGGALAGKSVARISAGQYHTLALCTDGTLVAWGYNARGQLGDGSTNDRHSPTLVDLTEIVAGGAIQSVSAGGSHSLALLEDGSPAGWGDNSRGQLVMDGAPRFEIPQALGGSALDLHAGADHSVARRTPQAIDAWGDARATWSTDGPDGGLASPPWIAVASGPAAFHNLAIVALPGQAGRTGRTGEPVLSLADWRERHFGIAESQGEAADDHDCLDDGTPNLVKYAFGLDPHENAIGKIPQPKRVGNRLELRFTRPAGAADVTCGAEWSPDLSPGSWRDVPDSGSGDEHLFSLPVGTAPSMFMRLKVRSNMSQ